MPTPIARAVRIFNACPETTAWARSFETVEEAWEVCPRGDWLLAAITRADRHVSDRLRAALEAVAALVEGDAPEIPRDGPRPDARVWEWTGAVLSMLTTQEREAGRKRPRETALVRVAQAVRGAVPALLPAPVAPHRRRWQGPRGRRTLRATRGGLDPLMGGE